jgi:two-component system, cell cycle sensor histidine kinase and response regulator CckA
VTAARILIVEDEAVVALDLRTRLTRLGYFVIDSVGLGEVALKVAEKERPDLTLMDIRLRGEMDGIAAAEQIRTRLHLPVVFLTAHADDATVDRARVTEPFGYILKPFEERELRTMIEMALYKHAAERRLRESERRFATTLASIGDGVIATDIHGRVTFMNPVSEKLTGWNISDAAGVPLQTVFTICNETTRKTVENPIERVLAEGVIVGLANHTILISRAGDESPIDDCAAPIFDDDGKMTGAVLVFRDVSQARQVEVQMRHAQKMEAVGQLAGGIQQHADGDFELLRNVARLGRRRTSREFIPVGNPSSRSSVLGADESTPDILSQATEGASTS